MDEAPSFGKALRPAIITGIAVFAGVYIGKRYGGPVEGGFAGIVAGSLINGVIDYVEAQPPSTTANAQE